MKKPMKKIYEYDDRVPLGLPEEAGQVDAVGTAVPVKILKGAYKGATVVYGGVKFSEQGESLQCKFEYNLIEKPDGMVEDKTFIDLLGEILVDILTEEMNEAGEDFLNAGEPDVYKDN